MGKGALLARRRRRRRGRRGGRLDERERHKLDAAVGCRLDVGDAVALRLELADAAPERQPRVEPLGDGLLLLARLGDREGERGVDRRARTQT